MASKYDELDASTELEQELTADLRLALEPRGCVVVHHGTNAGGRHSPGGRPDIEVRGPDHSFLLLVEVTRRRGSAADGEFPAVTDHLNRAVAAGGYSHYGMLYVSPRTSARMSTNFRDLYNASRARDGFLGRVVAIDFEAAELMLTKLIESDAGLYPADRLISLIDCWIDATDDSRSRQLIQRTVFPEDLALAHDLREETRESDAAREKELKSQLERVENRFRSYGITGNHANITLIYLAFVRLYEERRQRNLGSVSRFTLDGFKAWQDSQAASTRRTFAGRMVEFLLREISEDPALQEAGLLAAATDGRPDFLHNRLNDGLVETLILPIFDQYDFHTGRVDVLGAVFETLARRGDKDTRVGQFFTPQQVVDFCADIVDLRPTDTVVDPAVGTGRFLIASMDRLLEKADESGGREILETEQSIRQNQLLGSDIDSWVATIAKMNMFIHGDGKSGIEPVNGLALGDRVAFQGRVNGLDGTADVVLTNPPLGETDYTVAAEQWASLPAVGGASNDNFQFYDWLGVVPLGVAQEDAVAISSSKLAEVEAKIGDLEALDTAERPRGALSRAQKQRSSLIEKIAILRSEIRSGQIDRVLRGRSMKGGALFLGAIAQYLRADRLPTELPEWRGGRTALIVDEAVLNTAEYAEVRRFVRRNFFVKAVISLSRDAFKYLAHTDAKTSIIYLIKKDRAEVVQREPIFFAHAERVGYGATGSWVGDDLPQIQLFYQVFRELVRASHRGSHIDVEATTTAVNELAGHGKTFFTLPPSQDTAARIDFFDARYRHRRTELLERYGEAVVFGDLVEPAPRTHPAPSRKGEYDFAVVTRTGVVERKGLSTVSYAPREMWLIEPGTLVLSSIDLVKGAVGVAGEDVAGLVLSKEMFAYRLRPGVEVDLHYLQLLLRSDAAREILFGFSTGTSNRTRIDAPEILLDLPLPPLPSYGLQREIASQARAAYEMQRQARNTMSQLLDSAQDAWAVPSTGHKDYTETPVATAHLIG